MKCDTCLFAKAVYNCPECFAEKEATKPYIQKSSPQERESATATTPSS